MPYRNDVGVKLDLDAGLRKTTHTSILQHITIKGAWPDHFFDHLTWLNFFEILIPKDDSYFSHSHPEIWHSKIGYLRRNNQKRVNIINKVWYSTIHIQSIKNNISVIFSNYFKIRYKSVAFSLWMSYLNENWRDLKV